MLGVPLGRVRTDISYPVDREPILLPSIMGKDFRRLSYGPTLSYSQDGVTGSVCFSLHTGSV